jgi:ubiquitin carboxyl-terminal hydrolase 4/11
LHELWNKPFDVFSPSALKKEIGKKNPMFKGTNQHDSQEFLNFLLDSLHEDLNRVYKKPYVELSDSSNRPDALVANEHWDGHLKRNQSIIVDLMQGQYKSTLQCPNCNKISVTFDPFMSIPIPIPSTINCSYFFLPSRVQDKIFRYDVKVKVGDTMLDVKR